MHDLSSSGWIICKGFLFLLLGLLSGGTLWLQHPTARMAAILMIAVWSFCRFYYFAFYVIERYVDARYRFSGLCSFARYWVRK